MPRDDRSSKSDPGDGTPSRAGWRKGSKAGASTRYRWQKDWVRKQDQQHRGQVFRHRFKIIAWSTLALGLIATVIVMALFFPKKTPVIAIAITDYKLPLTPNTGARDDLDRLARLDNRNLALVELSEDWTSKQRGLESLAARLASASPGGPRRDVLILYLSMHGVVNAAGEPCLLPGGVSPLVSDSWLTVRELLQTIKNQHLPDKVKTVLVLDAGRMDANWGLGLLVNGFADRLQATVDDVDVSNLVILNSAGPGQVGWCSPSQGGSVFGYFFWRGLQGAADAEDRGNGDGRVSVNELHAYLQHQVRQWTLANRMDVQEPMIISSRGQPTEFDMVWVEPEAATGDAAPEPEASVDLAGEVWKRHQELLAAQPMRFQPLAWEHFQHQLLQLERLLVGGKAYQRQAVELRAELDSLAALLARPRRAENADAHGLPMQPLLTSEPAVGDEQRAKALALLADPKATVLKDSSLPYAARANLAWHWVLENPGRPAMRRALEFVGQPDRDSNPGFAELHLLRMLDHYLDPAIWTSAEPAVSRIVALRNRAERAAVPSDERVFGRVHQLLNQADQTRRAAEDSLFVGDDASLIRSNDQAVKAQAEYVAVTVRAAQWAEAWRVHDQVFSELPYLAQWLLRRSAAEQSASSGPSPLNQLSSLVEASSGLRDALDGPSDQPANDSIAALSRNVGDAFDKLRKLYDDECYRLRFEAGTDQRTARDLTDVLAVPLATGEPRNELRRALSRLDRDLHQRYRQLLGRESLVPAAARPASSWIGYLGHLPIHPALAILTNNRLPKSRTVDALPASAPQDDTQRLLALCEAGGQVRRLLAAVQPDVAQLLSVGNAEAETKARASGTVGTRLSQADRRGRSAAPMLADLRWAVGDSDPTARFSVFNLHQLLLGQTQRTIDDFWGPALENQRSFFLLAGEDYLQTDLRIYPAADPERDLLSRLLSQRRAAAEHGLQPKCAPDTLLIIDEDQSLRQTTTVYPADQTPPGTAALFVRNLAGDTVPVTVGDAETFSQRRRQSIPVDSQAGGLTRTRFDYQLNSRDLAAQGPAVQVVGLYRGHEYATTLNLVHSKGGLSVSYFRPDPVDPQIVVYGHLKQRSSLTFILDCSGSMSDVVQLDNLKRTRLEVARSALQAILDSLAQSRNYRVALRVYGHRARWKGRFSNEVIYTAYGQQEQQAALAAGQPFNVHPSNDVELILPMGQFGPPENATVKTVLDSLEPAGETPLYLAVIESAVNDFRNEADSQQRIIVITDGVNEQSSGGPPGVIKLRQQVEEAFDQQRPRNIRLDIVGFNLSAGEQQGKLDDLKALARRTGGAYYSASDPSGLLKVLQDSLGLRKYAVENAQGELVDEPRELGTVTQLPPPRDRPQTYVARLAGAQPPVASEPLRVELSEALELFLSEDRRTFQFRRYTGSKEQELRDSLTDLPDPLDPTRFAFIGAHLPEWQGSALRFPISVQNADAMRFSQRPLEAWVEIKPVTPRSKQVFSPYTFFDLDYEPHRPVPVLSCLAASWPEKAEKAEISVWCKFAATPADEIIRLDQLDRASGEAGIRLKALRGAIAKVRTERARSAQGEDRLTVAVQYPPGDFSKFGLKVELDPPPRRANHTYYPEGGLVRHTFSYGLGESDKLDHARIRFTTRAHLQQQAVSLSRPLTVTVPDSLLRQ